jgi:hypothetical protein
VTVRRLVLTAIAMGLVAAALRALTGPLRASLSVLGGTTALAPTPDPERVVLAAAGLLAWAVWAWGALGLLLTVASEVPGAAGAAARVLSRVLLPASMRSAAGVALGVGLVLAAPAAAAAPAPPQPAAGVPDWPDGDGGTATPAPPDWPAAATPQEAGAHVVVRGDCLWLIAEDHLEALGSRPTDAQVAEAVQRWWAVNASVIGQDPDLIHPGQVLRPPPTGVTPTSTDPRPRSDR